MDGFETAAEEWANGIEVFPAFTKGGIISENIFNPQVHELFNLNNQYVS